MRGLVVVLLAALLEPSTALMTNGCPSPCTCTRSKEAGGGGGSGGGDVTAIDCSGRRLVSLPATPRSTVSLDLSANRLGPVINASFSSQMHNLSSLDLSRNGLTRLLACTLSGMLGLRELRLRGNQLQTLPDSLFADNDKLEVLDLSYNHLASLPDFDFLRHLARLKSLDLTQNKLTTLRLGPRFQVLRKLTFLDLSRNTFENIPADAFQTATGWALGYKRTVKLSECGLKEIAAGSLSQIPSLHGLDLSLNPDLNAANFTQVLKDLQSGELEELSVASNGLSSLVPLFSDVTVMALKSLDASNNSISDLPANALATVTSLRELDLSRNAIPTLRPGFKRLVNLQALDLSHNGLTSFKGFAVQRMSKLRSLKLSNNRLSGTESVSVTNLVHLEQLVLHNNLLTAVVLPSNTSNLQTLDFHSNSIVEFDGLTEAENLEYVDFSDNDLAVLGPYLFKNGLVIKVANFSRNSLTRLDNRAFLPHSPLVLDLSHNFLTELHAPSWVATQRLSLANNHLSTLNVHTFYGMTGLLRLDLSRNKLTWLHEDLFEHLDALVHLDASHNQIGGRNKKGPLETIYWTRLFRNLGRLETLGLGHNNMSSLEEKILESLVSLKTLYLNDNKLSTIYPVVFHDSVQLTALDLSSNPFHCSCDLLAFRDWLSRTKITVLGIEVLGVNSSYNCVTPGSRKGNHVTNWSPDEFECNQSIFYLILFGSLAVFIVIAVVVGIGALRLYRQWRAKRREKRRRRARILRELEQVQKGKYGSAREEELVLVSREIAAEIEDALERKKSSRRYEGTKYHRGGYIPWPLGGRRKYSQVEEAPREKADEDAGKAKDWGENLDRRELRGQPEAITESRNDWDRQKHAQLLNGAPPGHLDRSHRDREREVPRVAKLDERYPYIVREAVPVAERVEWVPRHAYQDDRYRYRPEPLPRRGQPQFVAYNRESIDSMGRPGVWTTANDYRPVKYWTLPSRSSREEFDDLKVHQRYDQHNYPAKPRSAGVRFEDHDHPRQYHDPRPGSYEYWRRHHGSRSQSQTYLPADYGEEERYGPPRGRDRAQRQYESIDHNLHGREGLGQRSTSQPTLAHGNASGWL